MKQSILLDAEKSSEQTGQNAYKVLQKKRNGGDKVNTALETQQTGTKEQAPGEGSILEDSTDNDAAWKHAEDSLLENLRTITLLHKQGNNGDLRKHSIYRQLVCFLQSFYQSKWGGKKNRSSLRQNFVKSDLVEILTNNLLVPAEIEVAVTKNKRGKVINDKKFRLQNKKITSGKNICK